MFKTVHHIAIICSNYEVSKDFYINKLGFQIVRETYREERESYKLDLKQGDVQIELFTFPKSPKRLSYPEAQGLRHVAFGVDSIKSVIRDLEEKGIEFEHLRTDERTGKKYTFFKDPDDLPIELYEI
ncbi:MAG: VOC family protein [Candidatus Levybacteria bacterium]|nr:VOC family protein [Candidatus Levybacteria bacterium]